MATPSITRSTRYTSQAITRCYYLPVISATNLTPTRSEMNAGTNLSPELFDWSGWTVTGTMIPTPDLSTAFESSIIGKTTAAASSITFYMDRAGVDVRGLLPRGTTGYIMFCDGGDVAGNKADVYPITVTSDGKERAAKGDQADKIMVSFAISAVPAENITVPA